MISHNKGDDCKRETPITIVEKNFFSCREFVARRMAANIYLHFPGFFRVGFSLSPISLFLSLYSLSLLAEKELVASYILLFQEGERIPCLLRDSRREEASLCQRIY